MTARLPLVTALVLAVAALGVTLNPEGPGGCSVTHMEARP